MVGPSFPPSLGGGPAIPPGCTVLPAIRSPNSEGWDFLVRRIEDQRSELDRKEKEIEGLRGALATMAQAAEGKDLEIRRLRKSQGPATEDLQRLLELTRDHAMRCRRALVEAGIAIPRVSPSPT